MNKKSENKQNIFETVKQVNEKERKNLEAQKESLLKRQEKKREEYEKVLAEQKIELLKIKQGVIDKSDKLDAVREEKKHYTIWQKTKNFIYHNKWWLGIASFFAVIAAFLIYDKLTLVKSDIKWMLICDDEGIYDKLDEIESYLGSLTEDYNGDGECSSDVLYIPISDDEEVNESGLYESNLTRLSSEFQLGETMLVIADKKSDALVVPEENLIDLEKLYPDNENVKDFAFYLENTDFAERIGLEGKIPEGLYVGVRKVTKTLSPEKDMQKNYDNSLKELEKLMENLSK